MKFLLEIAKSFAFLDIGLESSYDSEFVLTQFFVVYGVPVLHQVCKKRFNYLTHKLKGFAYKAETTGDTQSACTCSKLTKETLEQGVKYIQS